MMNYKKFFIISIFLSLLIFPLANFSLAATRELEVPIPGLTVTTLPALPAYIAAIFNFALLAIGILVFGAMLYGGFRYLTSAGNPTAMNDAKDRIFSAFLGLIILFSSYLILKTINPELLVLNEPGVITTSDSLEVENKVILYEHNDYMGNSLKTKKSIADLGSVNWDTANFSPNNQISSIKIIDPSYVVVLFEDINFQGYARLIESNNSGLDMNFNDKTSSILLIKKGGSSERVILYDATDYTTTPGTCDYPVELYNSTADFTQLACGNDKDFNDRASSIQIGTGTVVILYENVGYDGQATFLTSSEPNLANVPCPLCGSKNRDGQELKTFNNNVSSIQIITGATDVYGTCSTMDGNQAGCQSDAHCKWCSKCSSLKLNVWQTDKCVQANTDCGYTCSTNCGAGGECPGCSRFSWAECSCVPTTCSSP